jgi:hypothetical protein
MLLSPAKGTSHGCRHRTAASFRRSVGRGPSVCVAVSPMKVRSSAGGAALELMPDTPRKRVSALYGAQKLARDLASAAVLRVGPTTTFSVPHAPGAPLAQDARQKGQKGQKPARSLDLPGFAGLARNRQGLPETPGNLCWHLPPGDQRFSAQYFPARSLHDPARLVAPVAVAQQARLASHPARRRGLTATPSRPISRDAAFLRSLIWWLR